MGLLPVILHRQNSQCQPLLDDACNVMCPAPWSDRLVFFEDANPKKSGEPRHTETLLCVAILSVVSTCFKHIQWVRLRNLVDFMALLSNHGEINPR